MLSALECIWRCAICGGGGEPGLGIRPSALSSACGVIAVADLFDRRFGSELLSILLAPSGLGLKVRGALALRARAAASLPNCRLTPQLPPPRPPSSTRRLRAYMHVYGSSYACMHDTHTRMHAYRPPSSTRRLPARPLVRALDLRVSSTWATSVPLSAAWTRGCPWRGAARWGLHVCMHVCMHVCPWRMPPAEPSPRPTASTPSCRALPTSLA